MWPFDNNRQQVYQQYAQAYNNENFNGFDPSQALGHLSQFIQGAPPQLQQTIFQQHFEQMPYEHRVLFSQQMPPQYGVNPNDPASMAQGLFRLGQEQPNLLQRVFSHPILMGSAVVLTGLVAKHMLVQHQREEYGGGGYQQYDNGFQQQGGFPQQGGYQQGGYQQGGYQQQEINHERREEQELRRELRQEEREIDRLEDGEGRRHHRREDNY
jgi:hypothetical protein